MKNKIIDLLKGFGIGISNLIPGFSGGTAAVILNVYDRFVVMFDNLFMHFKTAIKEYWALLVGIIIGALVGIIGITKLIGIFPVQTAFFISGLVIASYPEVIKSIKRSGKIKIASIIGFILSAAIIVIMPFLNKGIDNEEFHFYVPIILFFLGALCAAAMVIPGLSGALILMIFGYFIFAMDHINNLINGLLTFNFEGYGISLLVVGAFFIGIVIGLVVISKFLKIALNKWPSTVYTSIFGILVASPFAIFWLIYHDDDYLPKINSANAISYISAVILFFIGIILVFILPTLINKHKQNKINNENKEETSN